MKRLLLLSALLIFACSSELHSQKTNKNGEQLSIDLINPYITCWGDSLTSGGGWTNQLENLSGLPVYNGGTGGEDSRTILARQGGDVMLVDNLTIPGDVKPVVIADRCLDGGIATALGHKVTPLLQSGAHFNPCFIGDVKGILEWKGSGHSDITGFWQFTRLEKGIDILIDKPTPLRTDFDLNKNKPYLQVIFMGQNGGYSDLSELIIQHKKIINHSKAQNTIVLGLSSGTFKQRIDYENTMRGEFGKYFISLREYLSTPIYALDNSTILSCYGLQDAGLIPTQKDLGDIALGKVPMQLLSDSVHYTNSTKTVIGNLIYKKCKELNIF